MLFAGDGSFWPLVPIPDLSLYFEESILQILPSASFIFFASALVLKYRQKPVQICRSRLLWVKLCVSLLIILLESTGLALRCSSHDRTEATYAAVSLELVAAVAIAAVVYVEHQHAIRTSAILGFYLAIGILIDGTKAHSYFLRDMAASGAFAVATAVSRLLLLVLEEIPKDRLLIDPEVRSNAGSEDTSGFLTRTFFLFLRPMMNTAYRGVLTMDDLGKLGPQFHSERLFHELSRHWPLSKQSKEHSLFISCCMAWKWALLLIVLPRLCVTGFIFSQPFVMYSVIGSVDDLSASDGKSGGLVLATIFSFGGAAVCRAVTTHLKNRLVVRMRGALLSHMSAKSYRLKLSEARKQSAITLMSADFESIITGLPDLVEIPFSILESALGMYFLAFFIKAICLVILIPLITTTILGVMFGKNLGPALKYWNLSIEARVAKTSRALSQLPAIKSLGLGPKMAEYIQHLRISETAASKKYRVIQTLSLGSAIMVDMITPVVVVTAALFTDTFGKEMSAQMVYPILGIVSLVQDPLARFVKMYPSAMAMLGCFERIRGFLCQDEHIDPRVPCHISSAESPAFSDSQKVTRQAINRSSILLRFENTSIAPRGVEEPLLSGVDFSIFEGSVVVMLGPTSSGKTTLAHSLLGETEILNGKLYRDETVKSIAICGQKNWLSNDTVRGCIVGACEFEPTWYHLVLEYCKLLHDLERLPNGDLYVIGSDGTGLSGGQRQRIGIARAVYAVNAGIRFIVLDDVFSALDKRTALDIFDGLCGERGLLRQRNCTVVLSSYLPECLDIADSLLLLDGNGHVSYETCGANSNVRMEVKQLLHDGFLGHAGGCSNDESQKAEGRSTEIPASHTAGVQRARDPRQRGDMKLYLLWVDAIGRLMLSLWMLLLMVMSIAEAFPTIYMRLWIAFFPANRRYLIGYALISASAGFFAALCLLSLFLTLAPRAANRLHEQLTGAVTQATLGFLAVTDTGSLLNRYSQDMELISKRLPGAVFSTFYCLFTTLVQMGAILSGATYMTAILPVVVFAIYLIQRYYLRTSRQLRLLDIESQAPLVSALKESATGLVYIRSFGCQQHCFSQFLYLLDQSQRPFYFLLCVQALLGLVLDLLASSVGVLLAILSLYIRNSSSQNAAGLAFLNLISLGTSFNRTVLRWTVMETSIGSLSRLRDFLHDTPTEVKKETIDLPEQWPQTGKVEFRNVVARYRSDKLDQQPPVLQNLSLQIPPGKKVGIMGRTGSGKSSLLYSLLGFLEYEGTIEVDGVDISTVQPDQLRSRIITISQEVVELDGTIRDNLLPFEKSWPDEMRSVRDEKERVELERKDQIARETLVRLGIWEQLLPKGGLEASLENAGYSQGEKQLFCIARAVVRRRLTDSRLVLVDEATASVDTWRDQIVREMMVSYFRGCTMIVVAHREETIADSNRIVHMASGHIEKVDDWDNYQE
ncbi:ABC multidrug transporter [Cordyceps javanica]|uniref:ABC multidrug transporter n=1 Tax=Cordyceps javanica TaxID=43265 RepID=A0A545UKS0_9HYPO|nr:ABC multidrug transporter [Cordyceps javanica]TQW01530.1 ABC multidrug transporter [Cordyceps javanica]